MTTGLIAGQGQCVCGECGSRLMPAIAPLAPSCSLASLEVFSRSIYCTFQFGPVFPVKGWAVFKKDLYFLLFFV